MRVSDPDEADLLVVQNGLLRLHSHQSADPSKLAFHLRDDVHHVRVALDDELVGDLDAAHLGDAAAVVAPQVQQLEVLGALLLVRQQVLLEGQVLGLGGPASYNFV